MLPARRTTLFRIPRDGTRRKNAEASAGMKEGCAETEVVSDLARSSQRETSPCLRSAQLCMSDSRFVVPEGNINKGSRGSAPSCSTAVPVRKFSGIIRAKVTRIAELSEKFVFRKLNRPRRGIITLGIAEEGCPVRRRVTVIRGRSDRNLLQAGASRKSRKSVRVNQSSGQFYWALGEMSLLK